METVDIESQNGLVKRDLTERPSLGPVVRRRLQRLQAQVDGATQVAQAAVGAHQTLRDTYERAFREACEDYGVEIPPGQHDVDINWLTGEVTFVPRVGP